MDAAVAGLVGTGVGAAIGAAGVLAAATVQDRSQQRVTKEQARQSRTNDLLREYVQLLALVRQLRYVALRAFEGGEVQTADQVDNLLTEMSRAYYTIVMIAPDDTARLAWTLREQAFDLWRLARDTHQPDRSVWLPAVREIRGTGESFRLHVRAELGLAPAGGLPSTREDQALRQEPGDG